ncbi:hypothetical protein C7974DRAFT_467789 [Boeremia exigua]|uniref:uncharacterized protein n=1 Tax=Boeremia exigua TaxID=749465 RepID=UPI001E8E9850|nr:uncharacterized protein C7974DRAFT_467789 [Boeremia exigua]KAH6644093.1 hypothetical protein C7974DRAFT_467789 [Boeremia exigua]
MSAEPSAAGDMSTEPSAPGAMSDIPAEYTGPLRILDLPSELLSSICSHLDGKDLLNVRRACRSLNQNSMSFFDPFFFSHLEAIIHLLSLSVLLEIAKHPRLSKYVTQVTLCGKWTCNESLSPSDQAHNDLHDGNSKSSQYRRTLQDVLQALPNLTRINVCSDSELKSKANSPPSLSCGLAGLQKSSGFNFRFGLDHDFERCSLVFRIVLPLLTKLDPEGLIRLHVVLSARPAYPKVLNPLELSAATWTNAIKKRAVTIKVHGHIEPWWVGRFLHTATNIHDVELWGLGRVTNDDYPFRFLKSLSLTGILSWSDLRRISLRDMILDHDCFTALLRTHQRTLGAVQLDSIGIHLGTWRESIEILSTMPNIHVLQVNNLLEQDDHSGLSNDPHFLEVVRWGALDYAGAFKIQGTSKEDNFTIQNSLCVLLSDYRTFPLYPTGMPVISQAWIEYHHQVDFRKATAAAANLVVHNEGSDCSDDN